MKFLTSRFGSTLALAAATALISGNAVAVKGGSSNTKHTQTSTSVPLVFKSTKGSLTQVVSIHPAAFTDANSSHIYTFTTTQRKDFSGTLSDNSLDDSDFVFSSVVLTGPGVNSTFKFTEVGTHDYETLDEVLLPIGSYTLTVNGTITYPATSGIFTGDLSLGVDNTFPSPAPEPKTYTLMAAGLGVMAFLSRRRRTV